MDDNNWHTCGGCGYPVHDYGPNADAIKSGVLWYHVACCASWQKRFERALEIGLEAGYKIKAGGYLGGNSEQRLRVGIAAALWAFQEMES